MVSVRTDGLVPTRSSLPRHKLMSRVEAIPKSLAPSAEETRNYKRETCLEPHYDFVSLRWDRKWHAPLGVSVDRGFEVEVINGDAAGLQRFR